MRETRDDFLKKLKKTDLHRMDEPCLKNESNLKLQGVYIDCGKIVVHREE